MRIEQLAGFIDAKGHLTLSRFTRKGVSTYRPILIIRSVSRIYLEVLQERYGGVIQKGRSKSTSNWEYRMGSGSSIDKFVGEMIPHLLVKTEIFQMMAEWLALRKEQPHLISEEFREYSDEVYQKMKLLRSVQKR